MISCHQAITRRPPIRGENPYKEHKAKIQERVRSARQIEYCLTQCPHGEKPCNGTCEELKAFISIKRGENNVRQI